MDSRLKHYTGRLSKFVALIFEPFTHINVKLKCAAYKAIKANKWLCMLQNPHNFEDKLTVSLQKWAAQWISAWRSLKDCCSIFLYSGFISVSFLNDMPPANIHNHFLSCLFIGLAIYSRRYYSHQHNIPIKIEIECLSNTIPYVQLIPSSNSCVILLLYCVL